MDQPPKPELPADPGASPGAVPPAGQRGNLLSPEFQPRQRWLPLAICLCLALAVWAVFGQTLRYAFVNYDDNLYVYENPVVEKGLTLDGMRWAFTHNLLANWHPLTVLSYMADAQCYGLKAGGYHLTNVLLHTVAVILLFVVLKQMTGALWPSAFVAAVFAIHPLRVESVAWVAERKDVLSAVFFMLTLLCYVKAVTRDKGQVTGTSIAPAFFSSRVTRHLSPFYWLAVVFFALGLMSKPMLVTLPFVLLLLDFWPLGRFTPTSDVGVQRLLVEKIPFFVLSAAACVVTLGAQQDAIVDLPLSLRIENALVSCVVYLRQMFWPAGLAMLYPYPEHALPFWEVAGAGALLVLISAAVLLGRAKRPWLLVGWLWYLGMLVPVVGLLQVGKQAHADRYTYLPQIGLYLLIAWGAAELCGGWRWRRVVLGSAAGAALAALLVVASVQTRYWTDSLALWQHTLACTSGNCDALHEVGNALAARGNLPDAIQHDRLALQLAPNDAGTHADLGAALAARGDTAEAIQHFERALQINPGIADAQNNLGNALARQGKLAGAIAHYQRALQLNPDYAQAHNNLGFALAAEGKVGEAIAHYQRALELKPDYADAHLNLGLALASQGKPEAIREYERAIQLKPDYAEAYENLGIALAERKQSAEAVQDFERAIQLKPGFADAHYSLGLTLTAQGRWAEAVQQFEQAVQLKPDYAVAHLNLGAALAHEGKTADALSQFQQALDLATAQTNTLLAEAARARLDKYQPPSPPTQAP